MAIPAVTRYGPQKLYESSSHVARRDILLDSVIEHIFYTPDIFTRERMKIFGEYWINYSLYDYYSTILHSMG